MRITRSGRTALLRTRVVGALTVSTLLACGGSGSDSTGQMSPEPSAGGSPSTEGAPPAGGSETNMKPGDGMTARSVLIKTSMAEDLVALGFDLENLPPLDEAVDAVASDREKLGGLMRTFSDSLGVRCSGCHTVMGSNGRPDFEAPTKEKAITVGMWNEFVRGYKLADGSPLFCDSCHQGKLEPLDRSDVRALGEWMRTNFVQGLTRRDGSAHDCTTCHGTPFQGAFLSTWAEMGEMR